MTNQQPYGYFLWDRDRRGGATPVKVTVAFYKARLPTTAGDQEQYLKRYIARHDLTEDEWALPLDQLAKKYPAPQVPPR